MARLFLLFTLLPLLELFVLARIGSHVGFLPTLLGVIVVGALGAALARREGFRVLREWQEALAQGRTPSEGVVGGALLLVAGLLLVTPGVISDVLGLLLLVPPIRASVAAIVRRRLDRALAEGTVRVYGAPGMGGPFGPMGRAPGAHRGPPSRPPAGVPAVIDVEGEVVEVDGRKPSR